MHVVALAKRLVWREERRGGGWRRHPTLVCACACAFGVRVRPCLLLRLRAAGLGSGMTPLRSDEAIRRYAGPLSTMPAPPQKQLYEGRTWPSTSGSSDRKRDNQATRWRTLMSVSSSHSTTHFLASSCELLFILANCRDWAAWKVSGPLVLAKISARGSTSRAQVSITACCRYRWSLLAMTRKPTSLKQSGCLESWVRENSLTQCSGPCQFLLLGAAPGAARARDAGRKACTRRCSMVGVTQRWSRTRRRQQEARRNLFAQFVVCVSECTCLFNSLSI